MLLDDDVFDFANLPISQSSDEMTKQNAGMNHFPVNHSKLILRNKKEKRTFESGSTQAVLLGVGLALAVIALIVVLSRFYTAMRSDTNVPVH